jgi:hypothetical protein
MTFPGVFTCSEGPFELLHVITCKLHVNYIYMLHVNPNLAAGSWDEISGLRVGIGFCFVFFCLFLFVFLFGCDLQPHQYNKPGAPEVDPPRRTIQNDSERFRTIQNDSERLRLMTTR